MVKLAVPLLPAGAVPSTVEPSIKVMVPMGVPDSGAAALTVTVKTTAWPKFRRLFTVRQTKSRVF
jgi:hypothetical protein